MEGLEAILAKVDQSEVLDAVMATVDQRRDAAEIRETLGELTDLAWLSTIMVLHDHPYVDMPQAPGLSTSQAQARFHEHVERLNLYMRAAGRDLSSLHADELLSQFHIMLETRRDTLPESARTFVQFYEVLYTQLSTYQPSYLMFLFFINLADLCWRAVSVLESTAHQAPTTS
jgi:predicted metal-binding membrane protein